MVIAGRHIGATGLQHQTRQSQAAAQLENTAILDIDMLYRFRQRPAGRPQLAEQTPAGRTDAGARGSTHGISVLLIVTERSDSPVQGSDAYIQLPGFVPRHGNTSNQCGPAASFEDVRWVMQRIQDTVYSEFFPI